MRTLYRRRDIVDINRIGHRSARDADLPYIFAPLKVHSAFDVAESCDRDPLRTHKINRSVAEFELADLNPEVPRHGIFDRPAFFKWGFAWRQGITLNRRFGYFGRGRGDRLPSGSVARHGCPLAPIDGGYPEFRSAQHDLAHDQFPTQKRQVLASDPEVLSLQNREINRRILDAHILEVEAVPGCEGDPKD